MQALETFKTRCKECGAAIVVIPYINEHDEWVVNESSRYCGWCIDGIIIDDQRYLKEGCDGTTDVG